MPNIDTTHPAYQQALAAIPQLKSLLRPRLIHFRKLARRAQLQRSWLDHDPLLRRFLLMVKESQEHLGPALEGLQE